MVYPTFYYVFSLLSGAVQTAFSAVLPLMELIFKNWVSYGMLHMEALAPTTIVFKIDVFHALFLSTTAQKSKSVGSTLTIMVVDALQMMVSFYEIHKVLVKYKDLQGRLGVMDADGPSTDNLRRQDCKLDIITHASYAVDTFPRVRDHPDLALPRHLRNDSSSLHPSRLLRKN